MKIAFYKFFYNHKNSYFRFYKYQFLYVFINFLIKFLIYYNIVDPVFFDIMRFLLKRRESFLFLKNHF